MSRSLLFSCREATRAVTEALDRQLPLNRRLTLALHLAMCTACRRYRLQIRGFDHAVRVYLAKQPSFTMTTGERERVLTRLKQRS